MHCAILLFPIALLPIPSPFSSCIFYLPFFLNLGANHNEVYNFIRSADQPQTHKIRKYCRTIERLNIGGKSSVSCFVIAISIFLLHLPTPHLSGFLKLNETSDFSCIVCKKTTYLVKLYTFRSRNVGVKKKIRLFPKRSGVTYRNSFR